MSTAATISASASDQAQAGYEQFLWDMVSRWSDLCQKFLDTRRSEMLLKEPSAEDLRAHDWACKFLLRVGMGYQNAVLDVASEGRIFSELHWRISQLEASWRQFHNSMSEEEADRILSQAFPG